MGAFFGCIGDGGFTLACISGRRGDGGFNGCCLGRALVMVVSMVAVLGRAVVMVVSCWPEPVAVEVSLVASSPRGCVLCAKKFALHAQNTPKSAFLRLLGELFRGRAAGGVVLGELFRGNAAGGVVLGEFFRGLAVVGSHGASCVAPRPWKPAHTATCRINVCMKGCC